MRRMIPCTLLVLLFSFGSVEGAAQEKSNITVDGSKRTNGAVLLDISRAGKSYMLQCVEGASGCTALNNGRYQMVELPPNFGMYECKDKDVVVYAEDDTARQKRLGEYCLIEKQ